MTGYYLLDHKTASPQFRRPRREALSGAIGWHTTEGALDRIAPDTGAENVAAYIARRPDPGSYHAIHDSDSTVVMLPDDAEAFHVAADGINRFTVGQAAALRTTDWHPDDPATRAIIDRMAAWAVDHWRRHGHDPRTCARWLTRQQVLDRQAGMFLHGTVQGDRTDAWLRSPHRARLEAMTIAAILAHTTPPATPPPAPTKEYPDMDFVARYPDGSYQRVVGGRRRPLAPASLVTKLAAPGPAGPVVQITQTEVGGFEAGYPDELEG